MKLTKSKLKHIVKKELSQLLETEDQWNRRPFWHPGNPDSVITDEGLKALLLQLKGYVSILEGYATKGTLTRADSQIIIQLLAKLEPKKEPSL
tara:strand:+ start:634 stop:912 length:279 start_codon:yes stop_codon:yes gene_type:complete